MTVTRRAMILGTLALAGCGAAPAPAPRGTPRATGAARFRAVPNAGHAAWLRGFRARAIASGLPAGVVDRGLAGAGFIPEVVRLDRNQTENVRTLEDYLAIATSDTRIADGRRELARRRALLGQIEARYGVPANVVTAIWGLESRYGTRMGDIPVTSALSTLAYDGRRGAFFERQLLAALRIQARGDIAPSRMLGSWAGAMGHTQFIPTTFEAYAVDFRGDGRRDIWAPNDPTDALASAAAYLSRSGWRRGAPWGLEVRVPAGLRGSSGSSRSVAAWRAAGVTRARGGTVPDHGTARLAIPQPGGPAFLTFANARVLRRYNNSLKYVLGVGVLSDRIAGGPPLEQGFGRNAAGLTLAERKEIQRLLTRRGYDVGEADGVIGAKTEAAIRDFQRRAGLTVDGKATPALLRALR
ncbi:lytic murein transglycosylase [Pseudaestuariivita atlantica]|uniref:Murein transglycosylase n=1 Tax=Pseudaestuariivita atlantica TaxID=1317121 RepID=A0A0L1JMC2_9RHOB|nr:lytic murein transglycosylase [Pseudaestuariivita atlantica]KNG92543.1 murein transglycosylase [Pseudaestuariivita atlantica]